MTEDEWLDACADRPDDDMTRFAFADWLDERGDPDRAEFIRLQVTMDLNRRENHKWKKRAKTLLHQNRSRWLGSLLKLARTEHWCFHRGLPEELCVQGERLHEDAIVRLTAAPQLARLRVLNLRRNGLDDTVATLVATSHHLSRLSELAFCTNRIGDIGAEAIAASPRLASLTKLCFCQNRIGDSGATALATSPFLARLTYFGLGHNQIGERGARALLASPFLAGLSTIYLNGNPISEDARSSMRVEFGKRAIV
jgi:uncharacterized protein (TIGR02996 family)